LSGTVNTKLTTKRTQNALKHLHTCSKCARDDVEMFVRCDESSKNRDE